MKETKRKFSQTEVTCKIMTTYLKIMTFVFLLIFQKSFGQQSIITGKVLDEDLIALPGVLIKSNYKEIATTDINGNFKFKITPKIKNLEFLFVGMESEKIVIRENCNNIELIMFGQSTYCFMSLKAAERKIKRNRKRKLPKLYIKAYENGMFNNKQSCR